MDQWFWVICLSLGSLRLYVTASGNTWVSLCCFWCSSFLRSSIFFLFSIEDEWVIDFFCKLLLHYIALEFSLLSKIFWCAVFDYTEYSFWVTLDGLILHENKISCFLLKLFVGSVAHCCKLKRRGILFLFWIFLIKFNWM